MTKKYRPDFEPVSGYDMGIIAGHANKDIGMKLDESPVEFKERFKRDVSK